MLLAVYACLLSLLITFRNHCYRRRFRTVISPLSDAHHHWMCQQLCPCHLRQFVVADGCVFCAMDSILKTKLAHAVGAAIDILVIVLQFVHFVIVTIRPLLHAELLGKFT